MGWKDGAGLGWGRVGGSALQTAQKSGGCNVPGHLLSTGHLLSRGFPDAKDGRRRLFSQQTNISAVDIPHYRSFDAVDLAVARICIGTLVLSLAALKCLLSHPRRLLCSVF